MTQDAASRIQSSEAKTGGGGAEKGGFAARAQVSCALRLADLRCTGTVPHKSG